MTKLLLPFLTLTLSTFSFAQNPLSVHVLNLENGLPSAGVKVILEKQENNQWKQLSTGTTNQQGRITDLYPKDAAFQKGIYKVTFKTGEWFEHEKQTSFFPEVPVIFTVDGKLEHYHIPLLISPYGYSTYRGN
ncbi:hydroxyisourate hydrolase [Acinetobacter beijerinckii]|uniref:5-hydroxyisourate hydrolase n=1 Tax=Acinetobacter beijerinckii ANC 3835 TaxID=1217649 RepID=N9FHL6_9GAMM|nr:hydroxyisourate hydrolase [Acinetobacter beijerinckii]ENW04344.1 hydroxyisourate hydrolase [Acinetobacter beijerinckii ANC 3835]